MTTLYMNGDLKYECNEAIEKIIDKAYKRGYEDKQKIHEEIRNKDMDYGYKKGLEDAWECAKRIIHSCYRMKNGNLNLFKIFGSDSCAFIIDKYSATEAMQKIKEYECKYKWSEQQQNIKERKCETCDLFLKDCIGAVMLDGCNFYKQKQKESE